MFPERLITGVYIALGVATVLLVARLVQRALARTSAPATSTPKTDSTSERNNPGAAVASRRSPIAVDVSWKDRVLFSGTQHSSKDSETALPAIEAKDLPHVDTSDYVFGPLTPTLASLLPETRSRTETLRRSLKTAGFYGPHAFANLAAIRYVAVMATIVLFGILMVASPSRQEIVMAGAMLIVGILAWSLPSLYVTSRASERTSQIEHAMPDMIDMLNMCVSQGLTVADSFERVSRQLRGVYPDLAQEMRIVREQADVGTLRHALENFADRIDEPEVQSLTSLLIQTEQMGTSVSDALSDYSDTLREELRQRADEKANAATFKLLFPTVLCLMPAVYLFLIGPAVIELSEFFYGGGRELLDQGREALERVQ